MNIISNSTLRAISNGVMNVAGVGRYGGENLSLHTNGVVKEFELRVWTEGGYHFKCGILK
jgi:hypothetical protein